LHYGFEVHRWGFWLDRAYGRLLERIVEGQNRQETTNEQDQGTNKKTLAVDFLWTEEESMTRSGTSSPMEVWKQS
jgi:hypothetical protein